MKRFLSILSVSALLLLSIPIVTYAFEVPGPGIDEPSKPSPSPPSSSEENDEPVIEFPYEEYTVYTPKVTQLRNVNAMAYDAGYRVFYMPTLEDLPVKLKDFASNVELANESHKFAVVYDGFYDADAIMASTEDGARTTQKIFSSTTNTRALNTIGYDLLLSNEKYVMTTKSNGNIGIEYYATEVGNNPLTYKTIVMDIYKALGILEFDMKFAYGEDKSFDINESPILPELNVLTSTKNKGVDTSEINTYVAVTRTNPELYWDRYLKDRVQNGDASAESNVSESCTISFVKSANETLTLGEFCTVARALMNLYGEPVITETERQLYYQAYGGNFPKGTFSSTEIADSVMYLVAKGVVDPKESDFNTQVTYNDIDSILGRIADEDARLTIKQPTIYSQVLAAAGYSRIPVSITESIESYEEYAYDTANYYDFLIERNDASSYYSIYKSTSSDVSMQSDNGIISIEGVNTLASTDAPTSKQKVAGNLRLVNPANENEVLEPYIGSNSYNTYTYMGIVTYEDKEFYHFKINPSLVANSKTLSFRYVFDTNYESPASSSDNEPITIPNAHGGIYYAGSSKRDWSYSTFADANYSVSFKDKNSVKTFGNLSSTYTVISFVYKGGFTKDVNASTDTVIAIPAVQDLNYTWEGIIDNNSKPLYNKVVEIGRLENSVRVNGDRAMLFQLPDNRMRIEIMTDNVDRFKDSKMFQELSGTSGTSSKNHYGYYRASDGSLLVSYNYLRDKGLVTNLTPLANKEGYMLTLKDLGTNVTIRSTDKFKYVMVGDTIFPCNSSETLFEEAEGEYYVSYKACLGWAKDFIAVSVDDQDVPSGKSIMAMKVSDYHPVDGNTGTIINNGQNIVLTTMTKSIKTFFPNASLKTAWLSVAETKNATTSITTTITNGFMMSGSYGLAPYTIVMANDNGNDYLFVWHRKSIIDTDGNKIDLPEDKDKEARELFKKYTGIELNTQSEYGLIAWPLNRNTCGINSNGFCGFKFVELSSNSPHGTQDISCGWIYEPPDFDNLGGVPTALRAYAESVNGDANNAQLIIPIFAMGDTYCDANVNICANTADNALLRLGLMPSTIIGSMGLKEKDKLVQLQPEGTNYLADFADFGYSEPIQNFTLHTAPVGMFAELRGTGSSVAKDITDGVLYFGTSKCDIDGESITISGLKVSFDGNTNAIRTFKGMDSNNVYAATANASSLGSVLAKLDTVIEYSLSNPENLVDWDQFTYDTLTKRADAVSTIALIFILNILPRVAMLLFFLLLILAQIKSVPFWRKFCQKTFDVYSFLTAGHQTVDTIDTKRLTINSCICLGIFMVIMDGHLFNFMILIARIFIAIYQR